MQGTVMTKTLGYSLHSPPINNPMPLIFVSRLPLLRHLHIPVDSNFYFKKGFITNLNYL